MIQVVNGVTVMAKVLRWPDYEAVLAAELHGQQLQIVVAAYSGGCETAAPLCLGGIRKSARHEDGSYSFVGDYMYVDVAAGGYLIVERALCRLTVDASSRCANLEFCVQLDAWKERV